MQYQTKEVLDRNNSTKERLDKKKYQTQEGLNKIKIRQKEILN